MKTSSAVLWGFAIITVCCKPAQKHTQAPFIFFPFLEIEEGKSPLCSLPPP